MNETVINITTIHKPSFIEGICENINKYERDASILVIGDMKTPKGVDAYLSKVSRHYGVEIDYLDIEAQEYELRAHHELLDLFPYNTPDRVILGGMISYLRDCERIIAVDDDNFMTDSDFVGYHSITGTEQRIRLERDESGWYNVHRMLVTEPAVNFYPRGYPWKYRHVLTSPIVPSESFERVKVIVNQGLVLGDPDIDAIQRLCQPVEAVAMSDFCGEQFGLHPSTWSPFNYQNTSLCKEMIPLYYRPLSTKRNADIWTSYLFNRLAEHFGDVITFGHPLVKQVRNEHNLWDDLEVERVNNRATDKFVEILRGVELTEATYFGALRELVLGGQELAKGVRLSFGGVTMIALFFEEYLKWCEVVEDIV